MPSSRALPGIGAVMPAASGEFFGGIHRGFTPPSSATLKVVNFGEEVEDGGLDVAAEKSWNFELGYRVLRPAANFELTGFHLEI